MEQSVTASPLRLCWLWFCVTLGYRQDTRRVTPINDNVNTVDSSTVIRSISESDEQASEHRITVVETCFGEGQYGGNLENVAEGYGHLYHISPWQRWTAICTIQKTTIHDFTRLETYLLWCTLVMASWTPQSGSYSYSYNCMRCCKAKWLGPVNENLPPFLERKYFIFYV